MSVRGHNERSFRLDALASEARDGLASVEKGEEFTIGGWLAYGHALNEGRALFPADRDFGQWVAACQLDTPDRHDRAAAMWAAANADQFEEARQRGNPRTVRGIHAKWKEIEAERELQEQEAKRLEQLEAARASNDDQEKPTSEIKAVEPSTTQEPEPDQETACETAGNPVADKDGESVASVAAGGPDPHAKLRAEYHRLTDEAREDEWVNLRVQVQEDRKRIEAQRSEIADLKQQVKELSDKDDPARKLAAKHKQMIAAKYARDEAMTNAKRFEYRMKQAEKERDEAKRQLEAQEIQL